MSSLSILPFLPPQLVGGSPPLLSEFIIMSSRAASVSIQPLRPAVTPIDSHITKMISANYQNPLKCQIPLPPSWVVIVVMILGGGCVAVKFPVSVNNPFFKDPSSNQLQIWALAHPQGPHLRITNSAGNPLPSNTATLSLNKVNGLNRQRSLLDPVLFEKHASFNRERIPERVVHAKGQGAFGHFIVTQILPIRYTKAKVFNRLGKVTPVFVRFSNTAGGSSSADTIPDGRGFATRFYTEDGNLDFPGLQVDAFSIRDAMVFPDLQKSTKKNPATHLDDLNQFYDFFSLRPEIVHQFIKKASDYARPGSMRGMNGSSVNAYMCTNSEGEQVYCKFTWQTMQNIPPLSDAETISLAGSQPDFYTKDLYDAIATGNYPKWTFYMQVMTFEQADALPFNPLDVTKVWRFEDFPLIPIGILVLDKNPVDYFSQIEQAAFGPGNIVPGITLSEDPVLVARAFAYPDAQRYRLGPNFNLIDVNRPLSGVNGYERDGTMMISAKDNGNGGPVYFPNSFNGPRIDPQTEEPNSLLTGIASRSDSGDDDNFTHTRQYLEINVGPEEQERIAGRIALALNSVLPAIRARVLVNCIYPLGRKFGDMVVRSLQALENSNVGQIS